MAFSEVLADRIRQGLARRKGVEEKEMFGSVGFGRTLGVVEDCGFPGSVVKCCTTFSRSLSAIKEKNYPENRILGLTT